MSTQTDLRVFQGIEFGANPLFNKEGSAYVGQSCKTSLHHLIARLILFARSWLAFSEQSRGSAYARRRMISLEGRVRHWEVIKGKYAYNPGNAPRTESARVYLSWISEQLLMAFDLSSGWKTTMTTKSSYMHGYVIAAAAGKEGLEASARKSDLQRAWELITNKPKNLKPQKEKRELELAPEEAKEAIIEWALKLKQDYRAFRSALLDSSAFNESEVRCAAARIKGTIWRVNLTITAIPST